MFAMVAISAPRGILPPGPAAAGEVLATLVGGTGLQGPPRGGGPFHFVLRDVEGRPVSTAGLKGKVVLVSFFATWCPTCKAELPALRELAHRFQDDEFAHLFVNYGEAHETVRSFARELDFAHAVLLDPGTRVGDSLGVKFLPTHFLFDPRGEVVGTGVGPKVWGGPEAARLIEGLLGRRG